MQSSKVLPNPTKRQIIGYCAVRQFEDGAQWLDYSTFGTSPNDSALMAAGRPTNPEIETANKLAPIIGYVGVKVDITERIAA